MFTSCCPIQRFALIKVTALAAIKALAVTNGVLLGAIASRRGRRQADERLNIVDFGSGTGKEPQAGIVIRIGKIK